MSRSTLRALAPAALVAGLLAACSPTVDSHGHVVPERIANELEPGLVTKDGVVALLGTPSSVAPFDQNTWYYIGQKVGTIAFFRPDLIERQVLVLRFDADGFLESAAQLSAEDGTEIALVDRETPTAGHELGFLEQLLGNVGRFNAPQGGGRVGVPGT